MTTPTHISSYARLNASSATIAEQLSGNRLIDALSRATRARVLRACKTVDLELGKVLYQPGKRLHHAWFPLNGFISLLTPTEHRSELQLTVVGKEGMLGIEPVLGIPESQQRALVLDAGSALRIDVSALRRELRRGAALQRLLNRYIHVLVTHLAQNASCITSHKIEQRLACWLLMSHDRASAETIDITQASLAGMLGVRRVGVTQAAGALQQRGLIRYSRGRLSVTDRPGLEHVACGCYRADCDSHQRWLG